MHLNIWDIPALYLGIGIGLWIMVGWQLLQRWVYAGAMILMVFFFMPVVVELVLGNQHIPTGQLLLAFFGPIMLLAYSVQKLPTYPRFIMPVIVFMVIVVLSTVWNNLPLWDYKNTLLPMIFAMLIYFSIVDVQSLRLIIRIFIFFVLVSTTIGGLQYSGYDQFYLPHQRTLETAAGFRRGVGLSYHFAQTGLYCTAVIPIAMMGVVTAKNWKYRMMWAIPGIFAISGITFTALRAALGGGIVGAFVSLWIWNKRKIIPFSIITLVILVFLFGTVPLFRESSIALFDHAVTVDSSAERRPVLIRMAMDIWSNFPVFGAGPAIFKRMLGHGDAHNTYLDILAQYGLLGMFSFLAILYYCFRNLLVAIRESECLKTDAIALTGSLAAICTVSTVHAFDYVSLFWLFPSIALAVGKIHAQELAESSRDGMRQHKLNDYSDRLVI